MDVLTAPLRTVIGESSNTVLPPGFLETVAETGIDPRTLFANPPESQSGKCSCLWVGHAVYNFTGLGDKDGGIGRTSHP